MGIADGATPTGLCMCSVRPGEPCQGCWNSPAPGYPHQQWTVPIIPPQPMGCICPGDATPFCQNPICPRKGPAS